METLADALERALRFVRETRAPLIAASWALVAFLVSGFLIRLRQDNFGWKLGTSLLAFGGAAGALLWWSLQPEHEPYAYKFVNVGGTPCVIFGPGHVKVAHSADEHVPLAQVEDCAKVLAAWLRSELLP